MEKRLNWGEKYPKTLVALCLLLLSGLVYGRFLGNYFTSEDFTHLYRSVIAPSYLSFFSLDQGREWLNGRYLPLLISFYRLGYQLFNLDPFGYHLVVLLLHAGNSYLVFLIGGEIFQSRYKAFFLGVIYATYSLHIISVVWLSCANYVLATFCYLLAFYLFIRFVEELKGIYYFFFIIFFIMALFCHEISFTLPVVILLYLFVYPPRKAALRRFDNLLFLAIPVLTIYGALFYVQYLFGYTGELVGARLSILLRNPNYLLLKPLLGMAVMLVPEISPQNWLFGFISYAAYLVDNYPVLAQLVFWGLIALSFLDRAAFFGLFFYLIVSFMLHFASFGSLNNYYLASLGFVILLVTLLFRLEQKLRSWLNHPSLLKRWGGLGYRGLKQWQLSGGFLLILVSVNIVIAQGRGLDWRRGGEIARTTLNSVKKRHPEFPPDSRLFFFNVPAIDQDNKVNIFRFRTIDDAFKLLYKDPSLKAYNIETNKVYLSPKTIQVNGGYLYLPYNQLLDLTHNPQIIRLFKFLKRPSFIFDQSFPASQKFYFRYQGDSLSESKIKRPVDFARLFEVQLSQK